MLANAYIRSMETDHKKGAVRRRPDSGASGKDMRSSLYKRIGLVKQESGMLSIIGTNSMKTK